jgi:hypothetical protein
MIAHIKDNQFHVKINDQFTGLKVRKTLLLLTQSRIFFQLLRKLQNQ